MTETQLRHLLKFAFMFIAGNIFILTLLTSRTDGADDAWRDEAVFNILVDGDQIGQEKFSIQASGDGVNSSSTLSFKTPGGRQNVRVQTQLAATGRFLPKDYVVETDIAGKKGKIKASFNPGQANFEYLVEGKPTKSGLLVGEQYVVLDTNVFHHFVFVSRLFDFGSDKPQSIEVLIPQEMENGVLRLIDLGVEKISVDGKKKDLHHLKADTGRVQIDLWIDDQKVLYKIALPARQIEVERNL